MIDIWILAGQSNMQGCGLLRGAPLPDPRVMCLAMNGDWKIAEEPLHPLWESFAPVHQNLMRAADETRSDQEIAELERETRTTGAGLGISFGTAWADATGNQVALVPCAHGGTTLAQWDFRLKDEGENSLYGAMLERVRRVRELQPDARLAGVLWYQGESDAREDTAWTYAARLDEWIAELRKDLGSPSIPFVAVQIGNVTRSPAEAADTSWQARHWNAIRWALGELPARVQNCAATATVDLGLVDTIHIDTPGLARLGKRLAHKALALTAGGEDLGPRAVRIEKKERPGLGAARVVCEGVAGGWGARPIFGFSAHTPQGETHPTIYVIAASASPDDENSIDLILNAPADESVHIAYGFGCNPMCNAADARDLPLLAFAPMAVE